MKHAWLILVTLMISTPRLYAPSYTRGVTLLWDPNSEPDLQEYRIYMGSNSGQYTFNWGTSTPITGMVIMALGQLPSNTNYAHLSQQVLNTTNFPLRSYFVATAINTNGLESDPSNEVVLTNATVLRPGAVGGLRRTP